MRIPPSAGAFRSAKTAPTTQTADSNKLLVTADPPLAQWRPCGLPRLLRHGRHQKTTQIWFCYRCGASLGGTVDYIPNPSLGLIKLFITLIFRYIPLRTRVAATKNEWRQPKMTVVSISTYVGIVSDPFIEFIINRRSQNKTTMVKTASAMDLPFGGRRQYDTVCFLKVLGRPQREGFSKRSLD